MFCPHSALSLSSPLATLMPTDRKQLFAPARSVVVSADDPTLSGRGGLSEHRPPFLPKANVAPLGFCCMMGYIQLLRSTGLEECWGCTPLLSLVTRAKRDIKASLRMGRDRGGRRAQRVMSHWAERGGTRPVTWLMADLPLHWRGEARRPPLPHTYTSLTDSPCCSTVF